MAESSPSGEASSTVLALTDDVIIDIAKQVPYGEYHALGVKLGLSWQELENVLQKNLKNYTLSATEILMTWKTEHGSGPAQRQELWCILMSAGLRNLARKIPILTVKKCRETLIGKYQSAEFQLTPWDTTARTEFADLNPRISLLIHDPLERIPEKKKLPVQGSINGIFKISSKRILLLGKAGYGKSAAMHKLSSDWASGAADSPLTDVSLLFALRFSEANKGISLGEAIKSQLLHDIVDVSPEVIEHLIEEHEGRCLVLLDGYDEFDGSVSNFDSSLVQLILGHRFPGCRVVVTSRPNRREDFEDGKFFQDVTILEIVGFAKEDIKTFVCRFFESDQSNRMDFQKQMTMNNGSFLVKIPFFCKAFCVLWQSGYMKGARTLTDIFNCMFTYLGHYARDGTPSDEELLRLNRTLGKVALGSLIRDSGRSVFLEKDFAEYPRDYLEFALHLGILKRESFTTLFGESSTTFEFFHVHAQEYCAGIYYASLTDNEQIAILRMIKDEEKMLQLEYVFRFAVSCSSKQVIIPIMQHICSMKWDAKDWITEEETGFKELSCLVLNLCSELPPASRAAVSEDRTLAKILRQHFNKKKLHIEDAHAHTVRGLEMLPDETKSEIDVFTIQSTILGRDLAARLWSCLVSFSALSFLEVKFSALTLSTDCPPLPTVQTFGAGHITPQTYRGVIESLPGLDKIFVLLKHAEQDILQIGTGLAERSGERVSRVTLSGAKAYDRTVSDKSMSTLVGALNRTKRLQNIDMDQLNIDGKDLVQMVEQCRSISTMKCISLTKCDVRNMGKLETYLLHLDSPYERGAIRVEVGKSPAYNVPRVFR